MFGINEAIVPLPVSRIRIAGNKAAFVAVADERGRLTAATPAKNPRHRAGAAGPLSNGRSPMKNVSLGIFDPARCRRNRDFLGGFPPKPRSVLRNRQGIPRLSGVSSRAREGETHGSRVSERGRPARQKTPPRARKGGAHRLRPFVTDC